MSEDKYLPLLNKLPAAPEPPLYRAVLHAGDTSTLEHWQIQRRQRHWIVGVTWHPMLICATEAQAIELVNRLERGVIYPQRNGASQE